MGHEDNRLYAKLTLDFADSPKIAPLSDRAFREYIEVLLWSTRLMTDGFIPDRMIMRLFSKSGLEELTTNDPVSPSIKKVDGGYVIHDFAKHQNTREKIEKKREAGRLGGLAKASKTVASARNYSSNIDTDIDTNTNSKRATRIPKDFTITDEMRSWAQEKAPGFDITISTEKFINYWTAKSSGATKLDWEATWRNWILNDLKFYGNKSAPNSSKNMEIVNLYANIQES